MAAVLTTAGMAGVASRIIWDSSGHEAPFTYIAVGTGTTAATDADTALETEIAAGGLSRAAGTLSRVTTTETDDTAVCEKEFTVTLAGPYAVTEAGQLNAASTGTLLWHDVFSAYNLVLDDVFTVTAETVVEAG